MGRKYNIFDGHLPQFEGNHGEFGLMGLFQLGYFWATTGRNRWKMDVFLTLKHWGS